MGMKEFIAFFFNGLILIKSFTVKKKKIILKGIKGKPRKKYHHHSKKISKSYTIEGAKEPLNKRKRENAG